MASKVQVAKFPSALLDFNDLERTRMKPRSKGEWNMDEDDVLDGLYDDSFASRVEILEQLLLTVKHNGGRLPYHDQLSIFQGLAQALSAEHWEIRLKCTQLIHEIIPNLGDHLDTCMGVVMKRLLPNIGDTKISVRRAVIQSLHVYMIHVQDPTIFMHNIVQIGLENDNPKVRRETINALPVLLTKEFSHLDLYEVTQSLAKKLIDSSVEDNLRDPSLFTMKKIEELVGDAEFNTYLQRLAAPIRRYYLQLTEREDEIRKPTPKSISEYSYSAPSSSREQRVMSMSSRDNTERYGYQYEPQHTGASAQYMDSLEFGIISSQLMNRLNDQDNFRVRAQAVEELKSIVGGLIASDLQHQLVPHMIAFISLLNNLLDDPNFKITTVTLEILCLTVEKLGSNVKMFLKPLVLALSKRMGDTKIVVRQAVMKVAMKLMQSYCPHPVLLVICENLHHRNSRVRQEAINIVIAALMTFPSNDFVLSEICEVVGPSLTDPKRQVRQAALECFAALAQAMGAGRLQPLVQAVDNVELNTEREGEGLMGAVQARLARRQLPRLNADGLVEYATPIPSSATHRPPSNQSQGADMDWILAVGGGNGSARSTRAEVMEIESAVSSARSTPYTSDQKPNVRRYMSAGKGRNRLPWENDDISGKRVYDSMSLPASVSSPTKEDSGPPKPINTWTSEQTDSSPETRRTPKRRQTVVGIKPADEADQGSYKQIHQSRLKRQQFNNRPSQLDISDATPVHIRNTRENGNVRSDYKSPRPFLDPITVDNLPTNNTEDNKQDVEESPIHIRPTLARNSATRRTSPKVPPTYQPERYTTNNQEEDSDSAYAASLEGTLEFDQEDEMVSSLRSIRNSASKKKAEKKEEFHKQSSQNSLSSSISSSDTYEYESGVYSSRNDLNGQRKGKKHQESPFETKPKLVRSGVNFTKRNSSDSLDDVDNKNGAYHIDYNPNSGVTFPNNRNSDVQIVGKGYSDDSSSENKISPVHKPKDRKRTKGTLISPLGMASSHHIGAIDLDDDKIPQPYKITLIGKGVFDSSVNGNDLNSGHSPDNRPIKPLESKNVKGVYGVGVKNGVSESNSYGSINSLSDDETLVEESPVQGVIMTKAFQDKINQKKQKLRQEELEQKKLEKERESQLLKEKERQREKLQRLSSNESLGIETLSINGSSSSPQSPMKNNPPRQPPPAITPRKKIKTTSEPISSHPMSAQSSSAPQDTENPEDWKPVRDPDVALRDALKKLSNDDWEMKNEGITLIRRICMNHPQVIIGSLHTVVVAINAEVKNLRSQVSRLAIVCLGDMFTYLKKGLDPDLDCTVRTLLGKTAESNAFIKNDVEKALECMVENASPAKAVTALISGGAEHKSSSVRKMTALFLVEMCEKMGPGRVLSGVKDITDKVLPTAANFMQDGSPETRYYGRKIFYNLMSHPDFDKMLNKHVNSSTLRNIQENLDALKQKGLGDMPAESTSAKSRRSGHGSRSNSSVRSNSAGSAGDVINTPQPRRKAMKTDSATTEEIHQVINQLGCSNWNDKYKALQDFQELCEKIPEQIIPHTMKIFDKFSPRLVDSNSKVNLLALQVMSNVTPTLKDSLANVPVLNMVVSNIVPNLSSKNKDILQATRTVLDQLVANIDPCLLIEPFATQAIAAGPRSKPEIVEKVAYLVEKVHARKPKVVILRVLPLMWHLLQATNSSGAVHGGSVDLRSASSQLASVLYSLMGNTLIEKAQAGQVTARHLELLQDLKEG